MIAKRVIKSVLRNLKYIISRNGRLKDLVLRFIERFPKFRAQLSFFLNSYDDLIPLKTEKDRAKQDFFKELKIEIEKYKNDRLA